MPNASSIKHCFPQKFSFFTPSRLNLIPSLERSVIPLTHGSCEFLFTPSFKRLRHTSSIMNYENKEITGLLLFIGGVQCVLGIIIAEAFYPDYSTSQNYISDLGVGPSALIFNSSVFLLGVLAIGGAYFIQRAFNFRLFSILTAITGIGAMGVGLFPEDAGAIHAIFSLITFLFAGLSAIMSYKLQKRPLSYFSIILGRCHCWRLSSSVPAYIWV